MLTSFISREFFGNSRFIPPFTYELTVDLRSSWPPTTPYAGKFWLLRSLRQQQQQPPSASQPVPQRHRPKPLQGERLQRRLRLRGEPIRHPASLKVRIAAPPCPPRPPRSIATTAAAPFRRTRTPRRSLVAPGNTALPVPDALTRHTTATTSSSSGGSSEQSSRSNSVAAKGRRFGHGVTPPATGECVSHDNSLVLSITEALIQHLVPTVDYYPEGRMFSTFLLSSRLFLHPYERHDEGFATCAWSSSGLETPCWNKVGGAKAGAAADEWTETFPYDFRDDRMMRCLKDMTQHVARGDEYSWRAMQQMTQRLIKRLSALGQYEEAVAALSAVALERPASLKTKQASGQRSDVMSVCDDPFIIAQQLTHIELDRLSFIGPEEFIQTFAMKDPLDNHKGFFFRKRKTSNLEAYINWFNRLSYLVATEICMPVKKKHRARIIEFFIDVAQECFNIGNFNSLMAIITGMNMSPVARLRKTWGKVNTDKFEILEHQMDPSSNFSNYRTALRGATQRSETAHSSQEKIVIPFFSLLIKDIYFLNEGCASRLTNGHINFEKLWELAKQVSEFLVWRQVICPFDRDRRILQYLVTTPVYTEDELHLASYETEGPENNMEKDSRRSLRSSLSHRENRS
ncbi:hypothetical protein KUCAC02_009394 [Chaenocephalus aceratus]|uniref:Uncharacterized protein n=1 Tax=Chaenocephalus aceratus TaxID=36190 RepID=A0ACB9WUX3_CHAAC|nr:hypothetical protein KUCAC02_009394 [Chaenocephalus aceratus]